MKREIAPIVYMKNDWMTIFCGNCQAHLYHDLPIPDSGEYVEKPNYCWNCGWKLKQEEKKNGQE